MSLNTEFIYNTFFLVLKGVPVTMKIVGVVLLISLFFGFLFAVVRTNSNGIFSKILGVYVSFARGTPVMVQIYLIYTALPTVLAPYFKEKGIAFDVYSIKGMTYAYVIFSFGMIPVMSEMFRGALSSIDKGQLEAAKAIGLSVIQGYRRIILPQALVKTLPVLCTNITGLVKLSSLAFAVSVFEIMGIAKTEGAKYTCYVEAYLIIAVLYVALNLGIEVIFKLVEKRIKIYA